MFGSKLKVIIKAPIVDCRGTLIGRNSHPAKTLFDMKGGLVSLKECNSQ